MSAAAARAIVAAVTALIATAGAAPALAQGQAAEGAVLVSRSAEVSVPAAAVWRELVRPESWWPAMSGEAANLRFDPLAGGCLCERVPVEGSWEMGSVEHGRVTAAIPGQMLQLSGQLGQFRSGALGGTLTVTLEQNGASRTRIVWDYAAFAAGGDSEAGVAAAEAAHGAMLARLVARLEAGGQAQGF